MINITANHFWTYWDVCNFVSVLGKVTKRKQTCWKLELHNLFIKFDYHFLEYVSWRSRIVVVLLYVSAVHVRIMKFIQSVFQTLPRV